MDTAADTKKQILDAAEKFFGHYGFSKTTMADIAKECDMSPANLYRFYEGKDDIIAEITRNVFDEINDKIREVLHRPGLSASERLETFIVEEIRLIDMICSCNEKIDEAIKYLQKKKPDLFNQQTDAKRSMIAEILAEGNRSNEFEVEDIIGTSDLIMKSTFLCKCQWIDRCPPIEEVEQAARKIVKLIVRGLRKE
jgi:AcrR family transcriptional regulator